MSSHIRYYKSRDEAVSAIIDSNSVDKLKYVIGNTNRTGAELTVNGHDLLMVSNQAKGKRMNTVNASAAQGPILVTWGNDDDGYAAITMVQSVRESYSVVVGSNQLNELTESSSISLKPILKTKSIKNVRLAEFMNVGRNASVGYEVQIIRGDNDTVELSGYRSGSGSQAIYHRSGAYRSLTLIDRTNPDDVKIHYDNDPDYPNLTLIDQRRNRLVIEGGRIVSDDISFVNEEVVTYQISGTRGGNGLLNVALRASIEGYTVRLSLVGDEVITSTNTRMDTESHFGDVFPVKLFNAQLAANGINKRDFFPEGCVTSPITYVFNVGNSDLILNSRCDYGTTNNYVMFSYITTAWEYDTPQADEIDKLFTLGERHIATPIPSDMLPVGKFHQAAYTFNCNWKGLLYQGNELRLDLHRSLTYGVIGSRVALETVGSPEFTDERLYPGEAVIISTDEFLIRFESPGYEHRTKMRDHKPYAYQSLFHLMNNPQLLIRISKRLFESLVNKYTESNSSIAILPHYDEEEKMNVVEINSNYITYCVVMWLFSLPLHTQREQLETNNGFEGLIANINSKLESVRHDIININRLNTSDRDWVGFLTRLRGSIGINRRNISAIDVIKALRGDDTTAPTFNLLYKYYFKHGTDSIRLDMEEHIIRGITANEERKRRTIRPFRPRRSGNLRSNPREIIV